MSQALILLIPEATTNIRTSKHNFWKQNQLLVDKSEIYTWETKEAGNHTFPGKKAAQGLLNTNSSSNSILDTLYVAHAGDADNQPLLTYSAEEFAFHLDNMYTSHKMDKKTLKNLILVQGTQALAEELRTELIKKGFEKIEVSLANAQAIDENRPLLEHDITDLNDLLIKLNQKHPKDPWITQFCKDARASLDQIPMPSISKEFLTDYHLKQELFESKKTNYELYQKKIEACRALSNTAPLSEQRKSLVQNFLNTPNYDEHQYLLATHDYDRNSKKPKSALNRLGGNKTLKSDIDYINNYRRSELPQYDNAKEEFERCKTKMQAYEKSSIEAIIATQEKLCTNIQAYLEHDYGNQDKKEVMRLLLNYVSASLSFNRSKLNPDTGQTAQLETDKTSARNALAECTALKQDAWHQGRLTRRVFEAYKLTLDVQKKEDELGAIIHPSPKP